MPAVDDGYVTDLAGGTHRLNVLIKHPRWCLWPLQLYPSECCVGSLGIGDVCCGTFFCPLSGSVIIDLKFFSALSCYVAAVYV